MRRDELRESIEQVETLPSLPGVVVHLLDLTQDESSSADRIAQVIESDAAMTARLLRLANSSLYNFRTPLTTVPRAVAAMGYNAVRCMALGMGLARTFAGKNGGPGLPLEDFWKHSLACGVCARMLALKMPGTLDPDEAFMAGLLHDLGRALLATSFPGDYAQVLRETQETGAPLLEAEERVFGASHVEAGKWLAEHWGLPDLLTQVIWLHHQPPGALAPSQFHSRLIYLVQVADWMAHRQMIGAPHRGAWGDANASLLREAGVEPDWLPAVQAGLVPRLKEFAPLINLECGGDELYLESLQRANGALSSLGLRMEREGRIAARQERRFQALHRMNVQMPARRTLSDIVTAMAFALKDGYGVSTGLCALPRNQGQTLWGKAWTAGGAPREFQLPLDEATETSVLPGLLSDRAIQRFLRETARHWSNGGRPESGADYVMRRGQLLLTPILLDNATVGYILADLHDWAPPDLEDPGLDEFVALSAGGALAISRMNLIHKLERRSEELASAMWKKEQIQKQLLHSERLAAVGKMAAGAAHEVNNPLAIISGRAQILLQNEISPASQKQLNIIVDQAARASKILNDLMRFARPTLPQKEKSRLNAVIHEVIEMFDAQFRSHGIELKTDYGADLPKVLIDCKQIQQVLVNLLINAEHAIEKTGTITVRTYLNASGDHLLIDVTDSGCGIPSDQLAKIFEPFFTTKEEGKGTGLGLSLAHGIITSHQGAISVRSTVGKGTTFVISLPIAQDLPGADEAAPAKTHAPTATAKKTSRRVLVVDDEEQVRAIICEALQGAGYRVEQAIDGADALERIQKNPPDLITLDIRMPRLDGMAVLRAVRERHPTVPVIVITGLAMEEEVEAAEVLGITAFVRKPFEVGHLLQEIQQALGA